MTKAKAKAKADGGKVEQIDREIAAASEDMRKRFAALHEKRAKALESEQASDNDPA